MGEDSRAEEWSWKEREGDENWEESLEHRKGLMQQHSDLKFRVLRPEKGCSCGAGEGGILIGKIILILKAFS